MESFLIYFLVSFAIIFIAWLVLGKTITMKEFFILMAVQAAVCGGVCAAIYYGGMHDTETWNSYVVTKEREEVSCSHSYSCNCLQVCSSDSNGGSSCHTQCDTCYEHSYDVDWVVQDTIGDFRISRIDRRGLGEPPRWTSVQRRRQEPGFQLWCRW